MNKPLVAIVGRPNVGKSTLFNRIIGKRIAIVEDTAGITRDRLYSEADWNGIEFVVIDTGGIVINDQDPLKAEVTTQAKIAVEEADVILFIVDVVCGVTPADWEIANILRSSSKPIIVVSNKSDNSARDMDSSEFYKLGFEKVVSVSSLNGRSVGDLLDEVVNVLPDIEESESEDEELIKIAIIGKPNVGKSSLINSIIGEKRVIVSNIPGTTRDAIDTRINWGNSKLSLIDTAGIRKSGKIQGSIEYYTVLRAVRAMERADVAMVVIDGYEGLTDGDKRVASFAHDAGRACMFVVNKWDLCNKKVMREYSDLLLEQIPMLSYAPIVFTSALTGMGVASAVDTAIDIAGNHAMRIQTGDLNRLIHEAVDAHPYGRKGREFKIKYASMVSVKPPTIALFVNEPDLAHFSYRRYLENRIREVYGYEGTPIRLLVRKAKKERKHQ